VKEKSLSRFEEGRGCAELAEGHEGEVEMVWVRRVFVYDARRLSCSLTLTNSRQNWITRIMLNDRITNASQNARTKSKQIKKGPSV